jgi:predicted NBD/HSP70 family sugar kinase
MMSGGIDTTSTVLHGAVLGGTGTVLAQPDHTTQIIAVIGQILALVLLFFRPKMQKQTN